MSGYFNGCISIIKDSKHPHRKAALGTLCRLTLSGKFPIEKMTELLKDESVKRLLISLASKERDIDQQPAIRVLEQISN